MLVSFPDMRHHTRDLDLESPRVVPDFDHVKLDKGLTAGLSGVQVYALGTDGAGESIAYWQSLKRFWRDIFAMRTPRCAATQCYERFLSLHC